MRAVWDDGKPSRWPKWSDVLIVVGIVVGLAVAHGLIALVK